MFGDFLMTDLFYIVRYITLIFVFSYYIYYITPLILKLFPRLFNFSVPKFSFGSQMTDAGINMLRKHKPVGDNNVLSKTVKKTSSRSIDDILRT